MKEIGEIQGTIETLYASMRTLAHKLADDFSHEDVEIIIAPTMRQSALEKEQAFNEMKAKREEFLKTLSEREEGKEAAGQERILQKERIKRFEAIRLSLGAIAFEQAGWKEADSKLKELIKPYIERFTSLSEQVEEKKGFFRFIAESKFRRLKKHQDREFSAIMDILEKEDSLSLLTGDRASALLREYKQLSSSIEEGHRKLKAFAADTEDSAAFSDNELSRIDDELKLLEEEYEEAFISYGFYLFENGAKWITANTAESELDLISEMLECQNQLDFQNKLIQMKKDQIAIDDFNAIIENNYKTISALRSEIERIERQIADVDEENRVLYGKIQKLKESSGV